MAIVSILMSAGTIIMYFFLSLFIPFLTYLIPKYKITKVNLYKKKYSLAINILVSLILYAISPVLLIIYLIVPYMIEFLFYIFNRLARRMKIFDRIVNISLIITMFALLYIYIDREAVNLLINQILEMIIKFFNLFGVSVDMGGIEIVTEISKYYMPFSIFSSLFLANFFLFLTLIPGTYKMWKISCYWIIPYILILWSQKFLNISHNLFWGNNILEIIKYIFVWYGIKNLYVLTEKVGIKSNILKHGVSMLLGLSYPMVAFIIGALASFEFIEVKEIRM